MAITLVCSTNTMSLSHVSFLFLLSSPLLATPATTSQAAIAISKLNKIEHFAYFERNPRWSHRTPMVLTYAFSPNHLINYLNFSDIRTVFRTAFSRWGSVVPIGFNETEDYGFADIKIGFYRGDHGDSEPFDGVLGILAHSFAPESGKLHLDASEKWSVNVESEVSEVAVDLESVAMHEIGHVLGLGHSSVKKAIMDSSLRARERKVELTMDDVKGIQRLYGSRRDLGFGSLVASERVSNEASSRVRVRVDVVLWKWRLVLVSIVIIVYSF